MIIEFIATMLFFIFACFVILGVEAGNRDIINFNNEHKYSNALKSNNILTSAFKDQHNLAYEDTDDKIKFLQGISNTLDEYQIFRKKNKIQLDWWQTGVIYEIYCRSFKDSTGTGVGDIRGIIEKIPYLKDLGIAAIWLTPIYPSPGVDLGYDISDYRGIDEEMGTMEDFEELIKKLHESGIKIILDIVPNHTSEKHEWFLKSIQKIEPYTDYYIWKDAKYVNGTRQPPNNWMSRVANNIIWEWNEARQQYYLHQFHLEQPDLNFWNPLVRKEIKDLLLFWLDKGVDGLRMDAIQHLYERQDYADAPESGGIPELMGYTDAVDESFYEVYEWRTLLDEYKKKDGQTRLMIIESYLPPSWTARFYGNETNLGAQFPLNLCLAYVNHNPAKYYIEKLTETMSYVPPGAWSSWTIGNHDINPRPASRFGLEMIDGIHMIQLLLPGTPIVFMGDELGMTDIYLRPDQIFDKELEKTGYVREKTRTPIQWDSSPQAGFSNKTKTWLPVNPNYVTVNVDFEQNARRSHLKIFKELINLRQLEEFRTGDLKFYEISEYVFAFSRSNSFFKTYFIVINLGSEMENINLTKFKPMIFPKLTVKVSSLFAEQNNGDVVSAKSFNLRPSAALVLESSFHYIFDY